MNISKEEVLKAQKDWSSAIIDIGQFYTANKNNQELAQKLSDFTYQCVKNLYGYDKYNILFKPTKASKVSFRNTIESAVSYFIGGNSDYPEDKGFALEPWQSVIFENHAFILEDNYAVTMGHYYFESFLKKDKTKVEYTFLYRRNTDQRLVICVHHSSIPYSQ